MGHPELPLSEGSSVVITPGPFAYARGVFEGVDGEGRVRILLEMLGQGVPIAADFKTLRVE